ncbi:MAG: flavin reductase family protein [Brachybacterium sp.]|uniref:flavin reductase family protein n=1 Tax=Brachybacterium sp. TaxID=1891286 RepID=UPI0032426305
MSENAFAALMTATDPAMVVVTTAAEGERAGCLVGFHAQSSISPERYCLWLSKANHTYRVALRSTHFAVHVLSSADHALAERFGTLTGEETDKFAGLDLSRGEGGVPQLGACPQRLLLERITMLDDGGDHVCATARVLSAQREGELDPLRLSSVEHLRAGRDSGEHAVHP